MRAFLLLGACLLGACSAEPSAVDQEIQLAFAQQSTLEGEGLTLSFMEVNEDSRCPSTVQCGSAGQARITIEAARPGFPHQSLALSTHPLATSADYSDFTVTLLEVAPYPAVPGQIPPEDYVATLVVTRR